MKKINKLCIIEDDPTHLFILKKRIELSGLVDTIIVYRNGKEAYDNLKNIIELDETLPEIIFLDINMAIWDGWQFLEEFIKLKTKTQAIIYIVTSSYELADMVNAAKFNLKNNFLHKPIAPAEITKILKKIQES